MGCSQHFLLLCVKSQYCSVLGRVTLLPTFLSVVIIFLILTSSFWVLYLMPLLFQVYFRCSSLLDPSLPSSILPSCGGQGSASLRVKWQSPASGKPHKPRAAHASEPAWCGSEDLAPSEATGFSWTLFLLPIAWDRGHLFSGDHDLILCIHNFQPLLKLLDDASPLSCLLSSLPFTFLKLNFLQYCFCFALDFLL